VSYFYLSFCDANRPRGSQFLGASIVPGGDTGDEKYDLAIAIREAWARGCNPGGEVAFRRVPEGVAAHIAPRWIGRLLTRAEAEEFGREIAPHGVS
jgi:hypothetical protein